MYKGYRWTNSRFKFIIDLWSKLVQEMKRESEKEFPINCFKCKCFISWRVIRVLSSECAELGWQGRGGSSQKYYLFIPCLDPGDCSTSTRNILMLTILYSLSGENSRERTFFFLSKQKLFIYFNAGVQNGPTLFIPCFLSTMSALLLRPLLSLIHYISYMYTSTAR